MELTKEFVVSCRKLNILRDFLCQAIDQVDEKDKEIAELKATCVFTDNSAVIETMSNELERLRPMETALELAEADNKGYQARIKTLEAKNRRLERALWLARANYCHHFRVDSYIQRHPNTMQNEKSMENKMIIAEMNCWAKAKEYK